MEINMSGNNGEYSEEMFTEEMLEKMSTLGRKYAKYKGQRISLDPQRRALRSSLMREAEKNGVSQIAKQQRDAEADFRYLQICDALGVAAEMETSAWIEYEILKTRFEKWRTERADYRAAMNMR
jgi:hypothetical protein